MDDYIACLILRMVTRFFVLRLKRVLLLFVAIFSILQAHATHLMGGDITYKCLGGSKYEITVVIFRDCRGNSLTGGVSVLIRCSTSNSNLGIEHIPRVSIEDITPACKTSLVGCPSPPNSKGTNGIEKHTYRDTVDLIAYQSSCSGEIVIGSPMNARNYAITTIPENIIRPPNGVGINLYLEATINLQKAPCNNSPSFTSDPVATLCCNKPFRFNFGATDILDRDSLSYNLISPRSFHSTNIPYKVGYSYLNPFTVYDPRPSSGPPLPNNDPPIGLYLDLETGDIILTPTDCNEVTIATVEVTEWRKNNQGVYEVIGTTIRDMQFIVENCPDNFPPIVNGPFYHEVCENSQICFDITTNDSIFRPLPPAPLPDPDTVTISWNHGIPGATFTTLDPTARLQTGRFCWTPTLGQANDLPYSFTVTARDNACPVNAISSRGFRVRVKPRAQASIDIDTLDCGVYPIAAIINDGFKGKAGYDWTILDENNNIIFDENIASFKSNDGFASSLQKDTIFFKRNGTYYVQLSLNNIPFNCPSIYVDTLIVSTSLDVGLSLMGDTFVCGKNELTLEPKFDKNIIPVLYQWSTMGVSNDGSFLDNVNLHSFNNSNTFVINLADMKKDTAVSVLIEDVNGCIGSDTVRVILTENPTIELPPDTRICPDDSLIVAPIQKTASTWVDLSGQSQISQDTLFLEWFYNGSNQAISVMDTNVFSQAGMYVAKLSHHPQCFDLDTFLLHVNDPVQAFAGNDTILCKQANFMLNGQGLDTAGNSKTGWYRWSEITPSLPIIPKLLGTDKQYALHITDDQDYRLEVNITQEGVLCKDDDTIHIAVHPLPNIDLGTDEIVCCDFGVIDLRFKVNIPSGNPPTGYWSSNLSSNLVTNGQFNTAIGCGFISPSATSIKTHAIYSYQEPTTLCTNHDSIAITIKALPQIELDERTFCQDVDAIHLADEIVVRPSNVFIGTPSWRCLDSNSINNHFTRDMLENRGSLFAPDYWLNVGKNAYTVQNTNKDTIVLEFTYINSFGCRSRDTVNIILFEGPKLIFNTHRDLCFDEGVVSLNDLMDVNLTNGIWSVVDEPATYRDTLDLGGIQHNTINTTNSVPLLDETSVPNAWKIRYTHTSTGCLIFKDTTLRIYPLPRLDITPLSPNNLCETAPNVALQATPLGGTWSSNDVSAISNNNYFSPSNATMIGDDTIKFYYQYTHAQTRCSNMDSTFGFVDPKPILILPNDTAFCRTQGEMTLPLKLPVSGVNSGKLSWITTNIYGNKDRIVEGEIDQDIDTGYITLHLQNQQSDTFRIGVVAEGLKSCSSIGDYVEMVVHPLPDVSITNSNPEGCNPVTTQFGVVFNNQVNTTNSQYTWDFDNGEHSTSPTNEITATNIGVDYVSLIVTSEQGCDSLFEDSLIINPNPTARFVPSPNNYTTIALPVFKYINKSSVDSTNDSRISQHFWDFGDPNTDEDISYEKDPFYHYPNDTARYCATLRVATNKGCEDEFTSCVIIGPDMTVFVPNAFTPNTTGPRDNEGFNAVIRGHKSMKMTIFNRWGEIVFVSGNVNHKWDGTYKGKPAQQGVYAYKLQVVNLDGRVYDYGGTVTLIR